MRVFPKRKFDVVVHRFNPRTKKILYMYLTIFRRMWEIILSNMFDNAITKNYHFLCLLWSVIFLYFPPELMHTITILIFFTTYIITFAIYVCAYNITICVLTNCPFISLEIFIVISNWLCNVDNWFKRIMYIWSDQIDICFHF